MQLIFKEIITHLSPELADAVDLFNEIDSTNDYLLNLAKSSVSMPRFCLANSQRKGRGQLGRRWESPKSGNLYLSMLYPFEGDIYQLNGLSLAVGVQLIELLKTKYHVDCQLKWPNDIIFQRKKLGGILIETLSIDETTWRIVIGIGLNVHATKSMQSHIDQPITDLNHASGESINVSILASDVITALLGFMPEFLNSGFAKYQDRFNQYDALFDQEIVVDDRLRGIDLGVNEGGELLLRDARSVIHAIRSGSVRGS